VFFTAETLCLYCTESRLQRGSTLPESLHPGGEGETWLFSNIALPAWHVRRHQAALERDAAARWAPALLPADGIAWKTPQGRMSPGAAGHRLLNARRCSRMSRPCPRFPTGTAA